MLKRSRRCQLFAWCLAAPCLAVPSFGRSVDAQTLRIRETRSTTALRGSEFTAIEGMAEALDGTIWISDPRNGVIYGIDSAWAGIRVVARSGDGPGEVRGPHMITSTSDGGFAVHDLTRRVLELFDQQGKFRRRVALSAHVLNPKGFVALPSGHFVLSGGIFRNQNSLHTFGPDGRLQSSWLPVPKTIDMQAGLLVAGGALALTRKGTLMFSRAAPHELVEFSPEGQQLSIVASDPTLLKAVGDDFVQDRGEGAARVRSFRWRFPQSKAVFQLADGRVLNVVQFFDEGASLWQLYAADGKLVTQTRVTRAYAPWAVTRSGDVLASYIDPDTHEPIAVRLAVSLP